MAYEGPQIKLPGLVAGADLTAAQYKFVKISAAGTVILCAATTDKPLGVLQNNPASGFAAEVCVFGETKVITAAAITVPNRIGTNASGLAAAYVAGTDTTKYLVGEVITATGAANGIATAVINCIGAGRGA